MTVIRSTLALRPTDAGTGNAFRIRAVGTRLLQPVLRHRFCMLGLLFAVGLNSAVLGNGDAERGALETSICYGSHSIGDETTTTDPKAPVVAGIVGAPVAASGFQYTDAMREFAAGNPVWTEELLDEFPAWPGKVIPGTSMDVPGVYSEEARQDIIEYLKSASP